MPDLSLEKKKLEIQKVMVAKAEMEFKILERLEDIERLKRNIEIQDKRIKELETMIGGQNG